MTTIGPVTAVLIHGAWAEGWVWDAVAPALRAAGIDPIVVDLPGTPRSESGADRANLAGYVEATLAAIPDDAQRVVVVGHSGGGTVAAAAAEALDVRAIGVVFVAGIMLPQGMTFPDMCTRANEDGLELDGGIVPHLVYGEDAAGGSSTVPPEAAVAIFFQQAPAVSAIAAARSLVSQPEAGLVMRGAWSDQGFGRLPRLYVEALHDRSIPIRLQRYMQAQVPGAKVVTLDCDHAPQLSAPGELSAVLIDFIQLLGKNVSQHSNVSQPSERRDLTQ